MALHPLREATYEAAGALLEELAALFPDEYVHLGGDEVDGECWLADEEVAAWAAQAGGEGGMWRQRLQEHILD